MNFKSFLGVDVSKLTLDLCLINCEGEKRYFKVKNNLSSLMELFRELQSIIEIESLLVCAEHTGHYSNKLKTHCLTQGINLWLESGAEIKLRSGIQRNKNDKIDAERIALYGKRYVDKANLQHSEDQVLKEAEFLLTERELYIKERAKYKTQIKDFKSFINEAFYRNRKKRLEKHIALLSTSIKEVEAKLEELFKSSERLSNQMDILTSIDGVGKQVALYSIIHTEAFIKFSNGRKFACHVGVAPFSFESGTSQRSRKKVSHRANKKLKTLFHMAALSAIKMPGEFRDYFERKLKEGKNKMTILNAVRAKIINRMFALIRDNRKYERV